MSWDFSLIDSPCRLAAVKDCKGLSIPNVINFCNIHVNISISIFFKVKMSQIRSRTYTFFYSRFFKFCANDLIDVKFIKQLSWATHSSFFCILFKFVIEYFGHPPHCPPNLLIASLIMCAVSTSVGSKTSFTRILHNMHKISEGSNRLNQTPNRNMAPFFMSSLWSVNLSEVHSHDLSPDEFLPFWFWVRPDRINCYTIERALLFPRLPFWFNHVLDLNIAQKATIHCPFPCH